MHSLYMQPWFHAAAGILAAVSVAVGQPSDKCRLEGTVLNAITGQPVRKARLILTTAQASEPLVTSADTHGKYAFANLAPGTYRLMAVREGYMAQQSGASKPGDEQKGEPVELTPEVVKTGVDLKMTPLGAIMGFVRDEDGDAIRQVDVAVLQYGYAPTGRKLQLRSNVQTDALGEYRIFDLPPGTYYLRAKPMSEQALEMTQATEAYATAYYPNSPQQSGAGAIDLSAGQEQRGIDFVLHTVSVSFIRGRVIKPVGGDQCTVSLEAAPDDLQNWAFESGGFTVSGMVSADDGPPVDFDVFGGHAADKDGKFEFRNVPVGSHSITARCSVGKQRFIARMSVPLDFGGVDNLELRPVGSSGITGHVQLEGETKSQLAETRVFAGQSDGGSFFLHDVVMDSEAGKVSADGAFSLHNLPPDVYHIRVTTPKDLYVKSISEGGRDVQGSGVDLTAGGITSELQIVLSANGGSIEGTVENGAGATVTLIPADPQESRWRSEVATAGTGGRFTFSVLPPGRYQLFAWESVDVDAARYSPEFRKPFESNAQTVDVAEKQKTSVQLQLIPRVE